VRRRFIAVPVALACCLAFGACGSDTTANGKTNAATNPSTSTPDGSGETGSGDGGAAGPNGIPKSAMAPTEDGVKAFAAYWVQVLNRATLTGKTAKLKSLSLPSCDMCTDFAHTLDKIYDHGGHVETQGWDLQSEVMIGGQPEDNPGVQLNLQIAPQHVYRTKDNKAQKYPGGTQRFRMFLVRKDGQWLVQKMTI
jgi:hypothetical protein